MAKYDELVSYRGVKLEKMTKAALITALRDTVKHYERRIDNMHSRIKE